MFAAWTEARALLDQSDASRPDLRQIIGDGLVVIVPVGSQTIEVDCRPRLVGDHTWLVLLSEVALVREVRLAGAIYENMELILGSICLHNGLVFVRQSLPLDQHTRGRVVLDTIEALAETAAYVREQAVKAAERG